MRSSQTLSQRAHTSVTRPRSWVRRGSSQIHHVRVAAPVEEVSARSAAPQIAARLHRKISTAGLRKAGGEVVSDSCSRPVADPLTDAHDRPMIARWLGRLFTAAEANAALETVRPLAEELVRARGALRQGSRSARRSQSAGGNGGGRGPARSSRRPEAVAARSRPLRACVARIHAAGVQMEGLVERAARLPVRARGRGGYCSAGGWASPRSAGGTRSRGASPAGSR